MGARECFLLAVASLIPVSTAGCSRDHPDFQEAVEAAPSSAKHAVEIAAVDGTPSIWVHDGSTLQPTKIRCKTCHETRTPKIETNSGQQLSEFHVGIAFDHGLMSCLSCHSRDDYDRLGLADGRTVAFANVMTLCGQCHGPQLRDYTHGAHGGGAGYWDASKGPLKRNNCVHCHDPHSPRFRQMQPTFKPRDRFATPAETTH